MAKFLKTIRFDPSDLQVFESAAPQDEWALPGGFIHAGLGEDDLKGKPKQAFSNGFWSVERTGFSTFSSVADINEAEVQEIRRKLSEFALQKMNAPSVEEAEAFANHETEFVLDLCKDVAVNSIFALSRYFDDEGEMREEYRIVNAPGEALHTRVWDIVEE